MALTEAEELELLRLRKRKAMAQQAAIPAPGPEIPAEAAPTPKDEKHNTLAPDTTLGAVARGFAQGGTFGFADEIGGALGAADELARRSFGGGQYADKPLRQALVERYLLERDANRRELSDAERTHPLTTGAASLAGGLALPIPGAGAAGRVGEKLLKAAPRVGRFAAQGALAGGLMGVGAGDGLGDLAKGAAMGAASGAALGPATEWLAEKVTPTAADLANKLRETARTRALKTVMIQKDLKKIPLERQRQIADVALDSGTIEPFDNATDLHPKFEAARAEAGEDIGSTLGGIDDEMAAKVGLPDGRLGTIRNAVAERRAANKEWMDADAAVQFDRAAEAKDAEEMRQAVAAERMKAAKESMASQLESKAGAYDSAREAGNVRPLRTDAELQALAEKLPPGPERSAAIRELVERRVLAPMKPAAAPSSGRKVPTLDEVKAIADRIPPGPERADAIRELMASKAAPPEPLEPATEDEILDGLGVPMKDAVAMLKREVLPLFDDPALASQAKEVKRLIAGYEDHAARGVTLQKASSFKSNLQKTISKFDETPASQQARLNTQRVLDDFVEGQVLKHAGPDALREYVDSKAKYGAFAELQKHAKEAMDRNAGNRAVSLTDHGVAGTVVVANPEATGTWKAALAAGSAFANKQLRERGSSAAAVYADRLSKYLRAAPNTRSPTMNYMLEEYGPTLRAFAARGPAAAATAYYLMSQKDQRFRELDEKAQQEVAGR